MMRHVPILLPRLVPSDGRPVFGQWLVDNGDIVLAGDRLAEVLTGGVLVYVAAPAEGTLRRDNVRPGQTLRTEDSLGVIVTDGEESAGE